MRNYKKVITYLVVTLLVVGLIPTGNVSYATLNGTPTVQFNYIETHDDLLNQIYIIPLEIPMDSGTLASPVMYPGIMALYEPGGNALHLMLDEVAVADQVVIELYDPTSEHLHYVYVEIGYYNRNLAIVARDNADVVLNENGLRVMYYDLSVTPNSEPPSGHTYHDTFGVQRYTSDQYIVREPDLGGVYEDAFSNDLPGDRYSLYYRDQVGSPSTTVWLDNPFFQGTYNWGYFIPQYSGLYKLGVEHDDGIYVTVTGEPGYPFPEVQTIDNQWDNDPPEITMTSDYQYFIAGKAYPIDVAFYENHKVKVAFVLMMQWGGRMMTPPIMPIPFEIPPMMQLENPVGMGTNPIPNHLLFPAINNRAPEHAPPLLEVDPLEVYVNFGDAYDYMDGVVYDHGTLDTMIWYEYEPGNFTLVDVIDTHQLGHYIVDYEVTSEFDESLTISEGRDVFVVPSNALVDEFVYFIGDNGDLVRYFPYRTSDMIVYGETVLVQEDAMDYEPIGSIATLNNGRVLGYAENELYIDIDLLPSQGSKTLMDWNIISPLNSRAMTIGSNGILYMIHEGDPYAVYDDPEGSEGFNGLSSLWQLEIDEVNNAVTPIAPPIIIDDWEVRGDLGFYEGELYMTAFNSGSITTILKVNLVNGEVTEVPVMMFDGDWEEEEVSGKVKGLASLSNFLLLGFKEASIQSMLTSVVMPDEFIGLTPFNDVQYILEDLEDGARGIWRQKFDVNLKDIVLYETESGNILDSSILGGYQITYALENPSDSQYVELDPMTGDVTALEYYEFPINIIATLHNGMGTMATGSVTILDLFYTVQVTGPTEVYVPDLADSQYPIKYVMYGYMFEDQLGNEEQLVDPEWMIVDQTANATIYSLTTTPTTSNLVVPSDGESEEVSIGIDGDVPEGLTQEVYWADPLTVNVIRDEEFVLTISGDTPITVPGKDALTPASELYTTTLNDNFGTDYTEADRAFWTLMKNPSDMLDPNLGVLFYTDPDSGDEYYVYSYGGVSIDNNGLVLVSPYTSTSYVGSMFIGVDYINDDVKGVMEIATILAPFEYSLDVSGPVSYFIPVTGSEYVSPFTYSLRHQYEEGLSLTNPMWSVDGYGVSIEDPEVDESTMIVTPAAEDPIVSPDTSIIVTVSVYGDEHTTPVEHDVTLIKLDPNLILTIIGDEEIQIPMTGEVQEIYDFTYTDQYLTTRLLQPDSQEWSISGNLPGVELVGSTLVVNASTQPHMVAITLTGKDLETGQDVIDVHYVSIMPKQIIPTLYIEGAGSIVIPGTLEADNSENYNFYLRLMVPDVTVDTELHTLSVSYNIVDILVPSDAATTWALTSPYNGVSAQETSASSGYVNVTSGTQVGIVTGLASVSDFSMDVFDEYDVYPDEYALQASKDINLIKSPVPTRLEIKGATELLIPRFYDPDTTSTYTVHLYDQYDEEMDLDDVWWDLATSYNGITFDPETGLITVTGDASSNSFMINAGWPYSPEENGNGDGEFSLRTVGPEFVLEDNHIVDLNQLPVDYYDLNIVIVGNGSVGVTPDPDEEEEGYMHGTVVDLVPTAGPGFSFAGFSGPVSGNQIIMDNNYTITATFTADEEPPAPTVNLTITVVGDGVVSPGSANFTVGSVVQLAFTPADGWEFSSVTGPVDGNNQIVMDTDYAITVTFDEIIDIPDDEVPLATPTTQTFILDVYVVGQGTVSPNYGVYDAGAVATFTPIASEGWEFTGYNIQAITNNQLVMDQDYIVVAMFEEIIEIPEDEVPLADLPQTGGIGQIFFYLVGGMMMLLGATLIMRRNRSHN